MQLVCPYCQGHAFVMVTASDGAAVTVCTRCNEPVPFDSPKEKEQDKRTVIEKSQG